MTGKARLPKYSPAGRVPVLLDDDIAVWDTMAIIGHVLEKHPGGSRMAQFGCGPELTRGPSVRRCIPDFSPCVMNFPKTSGRETRSIKAGCSDACRNQIARIDRIWSDCRSNYGDAGKWLFGEFSIADIIYIPVALRFVTYSIPVSDLARQFISAVQHSDSVQQWIKVAHAERESLSFIDELTPAASSPLTLG